MDLKKVFKKEEKKSILINIRLSKENKKRLTYLAEEYAGGNVTKYIEKCCLEVMPSLLKERK